MATTSFTATVDLSRSMRYIDAIAVAENAGTPAEARVQIRNGTSGGAVLLDLRLAASTSKEVAFPKPIYASAGVYLLVSTGTARGSITGH